MKLYKYSLIAALALSGALSACDDDVKYNEVAPTPGVFFPVGENISKFEIVEPQGSFEIVVDQYAVPGAQTYTFSTNFADFNGAFEMPATVTFAEGEASTTVTVTYDAEKLAYGKHELVIGFAAGQPVNQFGVTELKIAVNYPEPAAVLPWNDLGECTYTDILITSGLYYNTDPLQYKVHLEQSGDNPGLYRLVAPYGTAFAEAFKEAFDEELPAECYDSKNELYLEFDATDPNMVIIKPQLTGVTLDEDGQMLILNYAEYYLENSKTPPAEICTQLKDGVLTTPNKTILVNFPFADEEIAAKLYYGNTLGAVKMVVFPGVVAGDYSAEVEYLGQFNNISTGVIEAVAKATFGEDVASAKAAIVNASDAAGLVADIVAGKIESVDVNLNNPSVSLPVYAGGTNSVVFVTFDENGEYKDYGAATFDVDTFSGDTAAWEDCGEALIADGWLVGGLAMQDGEDITDYAYTVACQKSVNKEGLYRFLNVWGPGTPLGDMSTSPINTALYVDMSDTDFIMITPQYTGWTYGNFGSVYAFNPEGYFFDMGYNKASAQSVMAANDFPPTVFSDGIITVELPGFCGTGPAFGGRWGYFGTEYPALIALPDDSGDQGEEAAKLKSAVAHHKQFGNVKLNNKFVSSFKIARKYNSATSRKQLSPLTAPRYVK